MYVVDYKFVDKSEKDCIKLKFVMICGFLNVFAGWIFFQKKKKKKE